MTAFKGGEKLERKLAELAANIENPGTLRVGFLENATYPDGKSVGMIAAIQEFGLGPPSRPFFRDMIAAKSPGWPGALGERLKANNYDAAQSLGQAGEGIKGQLQQSIKDTNSPPLAPSTIKRKGFDKPLIDKAIMFNSADYEVKS